MKANEAHCISKSNEPKVTKDVEKVLAGVKIAAAQGYYRYTHSYDGFHMEALSKALEALGYRCTYKYIHRVMAHIVTLDWSHG